MEHTIHYKQNINISNINVRVNNNKQLVFHCLRVKQQTQQLYRPPE